MKSYFLQIAAKSILYYQTECIKSANTLVGYISNFCNETLQFNNKTVTNIPIISSLECFQDMKQHGGIITTNFENKNHVFCQINDDEFDQIRKFAGSHSYQASIIENDHLLNIIEITNFFLTLLLFFIFFSLLAKCFVRNLSRQNQQISSIHIQIDNNNNPRREVYDTIATEEDLLDECSICIEPIHIEQAIVKLKCNHRFHSECIRKWFLDSDRCPNCNDGGIHSS